MLRASVRPGRCYGNEATKGGGAREAGVGGGNPAGFSHPLLTRARQGGSGSGAGNPKSVLQLEATMLPWKPRAIPVDTTSLWGRGRQAGPLRPWQVRPACRVLSCWRPGGRAPEAPPRSRSQLTSGGGRGRRGRRRRDQFGWRERTYQAQGPWPPSVPSVTRPCTSVSIRPPSAFASSPLAQSHTPLCTWIRVRSHGPWDARPIAKLATLPTPVRPKARRWGCAGQGKPLGILERLWRRVG